MVQAYTGDRRHDADFLKKISPIQHITPNYPPVLISGGNKDFLTETQSYPFVQVLKANQVPVKEIFYPESKTWLIHEYQFYMGKKKASRPLNRHFNFCNHLLICYPPLIEIKILISFTPFKEQVYHQAKQ